MHRERNRGFTLFELMVTIAVAAIILSFGVPGFMSFIDNSRATADTNDLITAMNLARSEATRRGTNVSVCSSTDSTACNGNTDWSTGWVVRTATDVLRVWPERSDAGVVVGDVDEVVFGPRGGLAGATATIDVSLPGCTGNNEREVSVNGAGRISVDRVAC